MGNVEKLIKSVNRYQDNAKAAFNPIEDDADYYKGKIDACEDIKEFIASLQQQPDYTHNSKEFLEKKIEELHKEVAVLKKEQSQVLDEVDLEKELKKWRHDHFKGKRDGDYNGEYLKRESQLELARYFWNKGYNARKL